MFFDCGFVYLFLFKRFLLHFDNLIPFILLNCLPNFFNFLVNRLFFELKHIIFFFTLRFVHLDFALLDFALLDFALPSFDFGGEYEGG